jgi:molybdate transport system permease protein
MPGVTQTMPLAVYLALQTDLDAAVAMSVLMLALSLGVLLGIRLVTRGLLPIGHSAPAPDR